MNRKKSVMVVADSTNERLVLSHWLYSVGVDVRTAHNGEHAIEKMLSGLPDVLLIQLTMPLMDGLQLAHYVQSHLGYDGIRIVLLCFSASELETVPAYIPSVLFSDPLSGDAKKKLIEILEI